MVCTVLSLFYISENVFKFPVGNWLCWEPKLHMFQKDTSFHPIPRQRPPTGADPARRALRSGRHSRASALRGLSRALRRRYRTWGPRRQRTGSEGCRDRRVCVQRPPSAPRTAGRHTSSVGGEVRDGDKGSKANICFWANN